MILIVQWKERERKGMMYRRESGVSGLARIAPRTISGECDDCMMVLVTEVIGRDSWSAKAWRSPLVDKGVMVMVWNGRYVYMMNDCFLSKTCAARPRKQELSDEVLRGVGVNEKDEFQCEETISVPGVRCWIEHPGEEPGPKTQIEL